LLLANHVEVQGGLLYASGVGWADLYRQPVSEGQFAPNHFGIGVSVLIPWDETNHPHHLTIQIGLEDGQVISRVETDVEVGRPPGLSTGADQRVLLGVGVDTIFPTQGTYQVVAEVGEDLHSISFRVHDQPKPQF